MILQVRHMDMINEEEVGEDERKDGNEKNKVCEEEKQKLTFEHET